MQQANRSGAMSAKTRAILRRKGILDHDVTKTIERLYNWDESTKRRRNERAVRRNNIDEITGQLLYSPNLPVYKKPGLPKSAPPATRSVHVSNSDPETANLLQSAFQRKMQASAEEVGGSSRG